MDCLHSDLPGDCGVRTDIGAYNEPDPVLKRQILFRSFESDGQYLSPNVQLGFDEVVEMAGELQLEAHMEIRVVAFFD
jgi:hypothetical protein